MPAALPQRLPTRRRVLVVDDDPRCRAAVARLLQEEGFETAVAADGEEASNLLGRWRPDVVLTDLHMPRLDGRGLVQRVRRLLPGIPVIVFSARGGGDEDTGAEAFLPKPLRFDELLARLRELTGV